MERSGTIVGYARTVWEDVVEGYRNYWVVVEAHPDDGEIEESLYDWAEGRAREIAASHSTADKRLGTWADEATPKTRLLRDRGYANRRYGATLVRPDLDRIPDLRLPVGGRRRGVS
jgi:hypothetical protein